jgi:hypothetical protein
MTPHHPSSRKMSTTANTLAIRLASTAPACDDAARTAGDSVKTMDTGYGPRVNERSPGSGTYSFALVMLQDTTYLYHRLTEF